MSGSSDDASNANARGSTPPLRRLAATEASVTSSATKAESADGERDSSPIETKGKMTIDAPETLPDLLPIVCGDRQAVLHRHKLGQGSRGPCIEYDGTWLTPNQFQAIAGRTTSKDWKRSIRYNGTSIKRYIKLGLIDVHPHQCACDTCAKREPTGGPKRKSWRRTPGGGKGGRGGANGGGTDWSTVSAPTMADNKIVVAATTTTVPTTAIATTSEATSDSNTSIGNRLGVLLVPADVVRPGISVWSNGVNTTIRDGGGDEKDEDEKNGAETEAGTMTAAEGTGTEASFEDARTSHESDMGESSRKRPYTVYSDGSPVEQEAPSHLFSFAPDGSNKRFKRNNFWSRLGPFLNKSALDASSPSNGITSESPLVQTLRCMNSHEPNPILLTEWRDLRQLMLRANVPLSPNTWTIDHVTAFIAKAGFASCCPIFRENFVDGPALMLLKEHHLINAMQIKVGPSLKLFAIIERLQVL